MKQLFGLLFLGFFIFCIISFNKSCDDSAKEMQVEEKRDNETPANDEAFTISKNFLNDYVTDVDFDFVPKFNVLHNDNAYTVSCSFSANHIKYNYLCMMAYMGGKWSEKQNWKLLLLSVDNRVFYEEENYKKYIKQ